MDRKFRGKVTECNNVIQGLAMVGILTVLAVNVHAYSARGAGGGDKFFTCRLHSEIRLQEKGKCPICLSELHKYRDLPVQEQISIPKDKLKEFSEDYILAYIRANPDPGLEEAWTLVSSYVRLFGKDSDTALKEWLGSSNLGYMNASAYYLDQYWVDCLTGKLEDIAADLRKRMLAYMDGDSFCSGLNSSLGAVPTDIFSTYLNVLGTLYCQNNEVGYKGLLELVQTDFKWGVYAQFARNKTSKGINIMEKALLNESDFIRGHAIAAFLRMGKSSYIEQALELLQSSDPGVRITILDALNVNITSEAEAQLEKIMQEPEFLVEEKVLASHGLYLLDRQEYMQYLIDTIETTADKSIKRFAIEQLGHVGSQEHVEFLRSLAEKDAINRLWIVGAIIQIYVQAG